MHCLYQIIETIVKDYLLSSRGQFCDLSGETILYLNTVYCTFLYFLMLLNTYQYFILLLYNFYNRNSDYYLSVFSPNTGKYGPEITPYLDTFYTVISKSSSKKIKVKTFAMSHHFLYQARRFPAMLPTLTLIKCYPRSYQLMVLFAHQS